MTTINEMTPAEKRSLTLSMKKAKESFIALNKLYSGDIALYDAFYDHWISVSAKAAWLKGKELHHSFQVEQLPKIEALFADVRESLIEKQTVSFSKKKLKRQAKNKRGRNDLCECGSNKKYKKCCLLQIS